MNKQFIRFGITYDYVCESLSQRIAYRIREIVATLTKDDIENILKVILDHNGKLLAERDTFNPSDNALKVITSVVKNDKFSINILTYLFFEDHVPERMQILAAVVLSKVGRLKMVDGDVRANGYSLKVTMQFFYDHFYGKMLTGLPVAVSLKE